uniref:Polycomb protein VEFS-Box domain-containing protein n=1 Tax=Solanum lycopersicum TaxID=4081 RepID=A0A3Q7FLF2_SOLLC
MATALMLDDFVDVTKDEKQVMHLWNSFVRKQRVLADGHIPWACEAFSKLHGQSSKTKTVILLEAEYPFDNLLPSSNGFGRDAAFVAGAASRNFQHQFV